MTGFLILFIGLTIAYIIYYAVMITLDLRAKPDSEGKEEDESFDVSDIANQIPESISVKSVDGGNGFQVGDNEPQMTSINTDTGHGTTTDSEDVQHDPTPAEQHAESCQQQMLEIAPMDNDEYSYNDGSIAEYITKEQNKKLSVKERSVNDHA